MVRILQKAVGKFAKSFPEEAKDAANKILEGRKQMFLEVNPGNNPDTKTINPNAKP